MEENTQNISYSEQSLVISFPLITFEDFVTFSFSVTLDPSGYFDPGSYDVYTVLPVDVTYFSLQRTGRTDTAGHYFKQPFILEYMFDVPSAILNISSLTRSCQWVSSSQATNNAAYTAVLPSVAGWRPSYRGQPFCGKEYLQLNLGNKFKVEKIIVYSHGGANLDYITQFIVQTSDNGLAWDTVLENGTSQVKLFNVTFNNAVKQLSDGYQFVLSPKEIFTTRNVRVIPKTASVKNCKPGLRIEFLGYKKTSDVSDNCTTAVNTSSLAVYPRTLLVDQIKGIIFACIETEIRGEVVCSKSEDLGVSWQEMDNSVANVVGVVANSSTVLGISQDGGTYMCSYNSGFDWDSCTIDESNEIKSDPKYTSYTVIPFDDLSALSLAAWKTTYGFTFNTKAITGSVAGLIVDDGTVKTIAWWGTTDWALEI